MYYSFANTFTELANEQGYDFTCKVRTTAGSNANIRLLSDGYIEIGIAQADLIADAQTNEDLRAIAGFLPRPVGVVRADSNIQTLDDRQDTVSMERESYRANATRFLSSPVCHHPCATKNLTGRPQRLKAVIDAFLHRRLTTTVIDELSKE
ncbi:MAG: TAXI family TRAP transporter solute-binding subunit [Agathobacter rectalis]